MDRLVKILNGEKPLTIFAKFFILGVWQASEYVTKCIFFKLFYNVLEYVIKAFNWWKKFLL